MTNTSEVKVGSVLYSSWGYEQTNVDFYEVTKKTAGGMVELKKLEQENDYNGGTMTGKTKPVLGKVKEGEKPLRRKLFDNGGESYRAVVKIASYAWAYLWDGQPKTFSCYA